MERESFKQRMKNLKSYRENNPGRGYWDWKVLAFEDGGEVGDPPISKTTRDIAYDYEDNLRKIDKVGKRPLEEGLKPAFNLEDFANFTPVGDALSVKDTYDAVRLKDWLGTGLAAVGMLPFVPNLGKKVKGSVKNAFKREVPTVNRLFENAVNSIDNLRSRPGTDFNITDRSDIANSINRVVEGLDHKVYNRAKAVDDLFNTSYTKSYDLLKKNYEEMRLFDVYADPDLTMRKADGTKTPANGRVKINDEYEIDVSDGSPIDDIRRYEITAKPGGATAATVNHEMGHIVDIMQAPLMKLSRINENALLKLLESYDNFDEISNILNFEDPLTHMGYLRKGTEIKSFMNLTRRNLLEAGKVKHLGDYVNENIVSSYMYSLPEGSSEKALYKMFKNPKTYMKWFNTIPVVGLAGAAYINRYHNDEGNTK